MAVSRETKYDGPSAPRDCVRGVVLYILDTKRRSFVNDGVSDTDSQVTLISLHLAAREWP